MSLLCILSRFKKNVHLVLVFMVMIMEPGGSVPYTLQVLNT